MMMPRIPTPDQVADRVKAQNDRSCRLQQKQYKRDLKQLLRKIRKTMLIGGHVLILDNKWKYAPISDAVFFYLNAAGWDVSRSRRVRTQWRVFVDDCIEWSPRK